MTDCELPVNMNRDFKGVWIPREIWLCPGLSGDEKALWAEIHSLYHRERGGCYATNEYLAKFMQVKERRLQQMLAKLRKYGLLVQVSFDGRRRIMKAVLPEEGYISCTSDVQRSAPQRCNDVHPRGAKKCTAPPYIENKDYRKEQDLSPPPHPEEAPAAHAAKAAEERIDQSKQFSPQIEALAVSVLAAISSAKPDFPHPKNKTPLLTHLDFMIRLDKREPQKILDVLRWALADDFWRDKMFKSNIAKYLREDNRFDRLEEKMNAKPPKRERKFAPSSDDAAAIQKMREMEADAI